MRIAPMTFPAFGSSFLLKDFCITHQVGKGDSFSQVTPPQPMDIKQCHFKINQSKSNRL